MFVATVFGCLRKLDLFVYIRKTLRETHIVAASFISGGKCRICLSIIADFECVKPSSFQFFQLGSGNECIAVGLCPSFRNLNRTTELIADRKEVDKIE